MGFLYLKVVLLCSLQQPQVCRAVFQFARTFARSDFTLPAPPLNVGSAEHVEGFTLADIFGISLVFFQQVCYLGGEVIDKHAVGDTFVGKLYYIHEN